MKIYILSHKPFTPPTSKDYVPLQVGATLHPEFDYLSKTQGFLSDAFDQHISEKNPYYSELTGLYWVWKNVSDEDIIGFAHYRRYLLNDSSMLYQAPEVTSLLAKYDLITTKTVVLDESYYNAFGGRHHQKDLDILADVIKKKHPDLFPLYDKLIHENNTYFGNMFITTKKNFHAYMEFLFPILFAMEEKVDMTGYDGYQKRLFGFVSEFLLYFFVQAKGLKVKESLVGILGEKTEIADVKEQVSAFFIKHDLSGAKQAFLAIYEKRPDILMEVSDINMECRLTMQAISSMEQEEAAFGKTRLDITNDLSTLIQFYRTLNKITGRYRNTASNLDELLNLPLKPSEKAFLLDNQVNTEEARVSFLLQKTPT